MVDRPKQPDDWGDFDKLHRFVVDLCFEWKLFTGLYFEKDTVRLLNRGCNEFFFLIQDCLYRDCLVRICAITDVPSMGGRENLTVRRIMDQALIWLGGERKSRLQSSIESLEAAVAPLRQVRHKVAVHIDHPVAMGEAERPAVLREEMESAVDCLFGTMNIFHMELFGTEYRYGDAILNAPNDVVGCVKDRIWKRFLQRLAKESLEDSELREIVAFGYNSIAWRRYCLGVGLHPDHWMELPGNDYTL